MNELPRGPSDLYNARHAAKNVTLSDPHLLSNQESATENSSDAIWMLLQKTKRDENTAKSSIFIGKYIQTSLQFLHQSVNWQN